MRDYVKSRVDVLSLVFHRARPQVHENNDRLIPPSPQSTSANVINRSNVDARVLSSANSNEMFAVRL